MGLGNQMYLKRNSPVTTFMIKNSDCPLLVKIKIKIQLLKYWLPSTRLDAHSWLSEGEKGQTPGKMWNYVEIFGIAKSRLEDECYWHLVNKV